MGGVWPNVDKSGQGEGVDFYCTLWMTPNEMCATHDVRKIHVVHDAMSPLDGRQTSDSELNRRGTIHELQQPITPARTHTHSRQCLRLSANRRQPVVLRHRRSKFGRRSFSVAAPMIWNSFPDSLRDPTLSIDNFRSALKTHLFAAQRDM